MTTTTMHPEAKRDNVGLPQVVQAVDGTVWSLVFEPQFVSLPNGQPWRYARAMRPLEHVEPKSMSLTQLSAKVGIRRVVRNSEGRLV